MKFVQLLFCSFVLSAPVINNQAELAPLEEASSSEGPAISAERIGRRIDDAAAVVGDKLVDAGDAIANFDPLAGPKKLVRNAKNAVDDTGKAIGNFAVEAVNVPVRIGQGIADGTADVIEGTGKGIQRVGRAVERIPTVLSPSNIANKVEETVDNAVVKVADATANAADSVGNAAKNVAKRVADDDANSFTESHKEEGDSFVDQTEKEEVSHNA